MPPLMHCVSRSGSPDQPADVKLVRMFHRITGRIDKVTSAETEGGGTDPDDIDSEETTTATSATTTEAMIEVTELRKQDGRRGHAHSRASTSPSRTAKSSGFWDPTGLARPRHWGF